MIVEKMQILSLDVQYLPMLPVHDECSQREDILPSGNFSADALMSGEAERKTPRPAVRNRLRCRQAERKNKQTAGERSKRRKSSLNLRAFLSLSHSV